MIDKLYRSHYPALHRFAKQYILEKHNRSLRHGSTESIKKTSELFVSYSSSIPKFAWLCHVGHGQARCVVGSGVEYRNNLVFEGAWAGDFENTSPHTNKHVFGSGVFLNNGALVFITPKHNLESIFVLYDNKSEKYFVSNSFCFLLKSANISTKGNFFKAVKKVWHQHGESSARLGVDKYTRVIKKGQRYTLYKLTYYNFYLLNQDGIKLQVDNIEHPEFKDFQAYYDHISSTTKEVISNAGHTSRRHQYQPISAISSGYDSVAVSAIASSVGCKKSITLTGKIYGYNDSGEGVAEHLKLKILKHKHLLSSNISNLNQDFYGAKKKKAHEFIATEGIGDDVAFLPFENSIKNRLYLSGTYGDVVWGMNKIHPGYAKLPFERSMNEFRLRVGFIHFPVISISSHSPSFLYKISHSKELTNYSINNDYNRPIPRKIAEDAGVPREQFGTQKSAVSPLISNHQEIFTEAVIDIMNRYELSTPNN